MRPETSGAAVLEEPDRASVRGRQVEAVHLTARWIDSLRDHQLEAARLMARSLDAIRRLRLSKGLSIDPALDPNGTGIVGDEFSPLTTSVGDVEAKRTSANPAFAALLVRLFAEAGVSRGDAVAVGGSGSFPGLLLATMCAARALELEPVTIYSVGASMYGANIPGFTFADMLEVLRAEGILPYRLAAVSPGGRGDGGSGVLFDEDGTSLLDETRRLGLPAVAGASLAERIRARLSIFEDAAGGRPIRCFVNVGGASANFGAGEESLKLPNGLIGKAPAIPASATRGLAFEFLSRGVRVIHLLHVKGLARDNGLPFDPVPFPPVGEGAVYGRH
jgi:poly-gamma-glutamate system protein